MNLSSLALKGINITWSLLGDYVRHVIFKKITGYNTDGIAAQLTIEQATCDILPVVYQSRDVDGTSIVNGDEKWLVRGSELNSITVTPSSGDWFEEAGVRWDIIAANRDITQQLWTFQVRRELVDPTLPATSSVDWGNLTAETSSEDWGDLELHGSTEDWNS